MKRIALLAVALAFAVIPAKAQLLDYPQLTLQAEGLEAPKCTDVPKLITGHGPQCTEKDTDEWLSQMRA